MHKNFLFVQTKRRIRNKRERHTIMKERICFVTLLTIGIVAALIIFFEKRDNQSTDAFDGVLVYESVMEKELC